MNTITELNLTNGFTIQDVEKALAETDSSYKAGDYHTYRAAEKLLQSARKAGTISHSKRKWWFK